MMTTFSIMKSVSVFVVCLGMLCSSVQGWTQGWSPAHATFYGGIDESGTNNGACGYTNLFSLGYGDMTTALSTALFNGGATCGACYHLQCSGNTACFRNVVGVTAVNMCPPGSYGGWCDGENVHFDLSYAAFQKIAQVPAGHVSVRYRRVPCRRRGGILFKINGHTYFIPCRRRGGILFKINGHTYFMQVLVYNVAGAGDVTSMSVNGIPMTRSWGQLWQTGTVLDGQPLSFSVTTSSRKTLTSDKVAGSNWQYGQTFEGKQF